MTTAFPATPDFSGHNAPSRIECDIFDLVVEGTLPAEFEGSWYRSVPDPQYPPLMGDDTYLSGDGLPGEGPHRAHQAADAAAIGCSWELGAQRVSSICASAW